MIVGRLARNADPAGDPADTGNGRLNLLRAMIDASTDAVQPAGAAPVGDGGPFVGRYVAANVSRAVGVPCNNGSYTTTNYNAGDLPPGSVGPPPGEQ